MRRLGAPSPLKNITRAQRRSTNLERRLIEAGGGGGIDSFFIIRKNAATTISGSGTNVPFTVGADSYNIGPAGGVAYDTSDDTIFDMLDGLWHIGVELHWKLVYVSAAADGQFGLSVIQSLDQSENVAAASLPVGSINGTITWTPIQSFSSIAPLPNSGFPSGNNLIRVRCSKPTASGLTATIEAGSVLWGYRVGPTSLI